MVRDIRIPLEKGTQITINGSVFTIGDVIGRGGLSLVYSATKEGGMTESVIKEFYPAMDQSGVLYAERDADGHVLCSNDRFQEQYANTQKLFKHEGIIGGDVANVSFQVVPFWEHQNGYAVMKKESADMHSLRALVHEWETNPPLSLGSKKWDDSHIYGDVIRVNYALAVIDSLLTALSAIHEKYLHLDLSSTNVIWACRELSTGRNGFAVISDFGSAATLENGKFKPNYNLFSSAGFAAPEIYNRNCTLTRKTDLYSVGMLLIYLCIGEKDFIKHFGRMKRAVQLGRDIAGISLDIQENFGSHLYEILMAVLVERKYTTAQEMQKDIQELHDKTNIYLLDQETASISIGDKINGVSDDHYIPRAREMAEIIIRLERNQNPIISGMGGIGKTTLARRFAIEYAGKYFIYFTTFNSSFRATIAALVATKSNDEVWMKKSLDEKFEDGLALLRSCSSRYVLIIDNADTKKEDIRSDPDYHYLQELPLHFIITTRNEMDGDEVIHLREMDEEDCLKLMKSYWSGHKMGQHVATLKEICRLVNYHTITIELIAKTLESSGGALKPTDILKTLNTDNIDDDAWGTVETIYGLDYRHRKVIGHLQRVFIISKLTSIERCVLGSFALADSNYDNGELYRYWSKAERAALYKLLRKGWLTKINSQIVIHPVIRYVIIVARKRCIIWSKCCEFIMNSMSKMPAYIVSMEVRDNNIARNALLYIDNETIPRDYIVLLRCYYMYSFGMYHLKNVDDIEDVVECYREALSSCDENSILEYYIHDAFYQCTGLCEIQLNAYHQRNCREAKEFIRWSLRSKYSISGDAKEYAYRRIEYLCDIADHSSNRIMQSICYKDISILYWLANDLMKSLKYAFKHTDCHGCTNGEIDNITDADFIAWAEMQLAAQIKDDNLLKEAISCVEFAIELAQDTYDFISYGQLADQYHIVATICKNTGEIQLMKQWYEKEKECYQKILQGFVVGNPVIKTWYAAYDEQVLIEKICQLCDLVNGKEVL